MDCDRPTVKLSRRQHDRREGRYDSDCKKQKSEMEIIQAKLTAFHALLSADSQVRNTGS